jgi:hypothetical protein
VNKCMPAKTMQDLEIRNYTNTHQIDESDKSINTSNLVKK